MNSEQIGAMLSRANVVECGDEWASAIGLPHYQKWKTSHFQTGEYTR
jgi:hypothetical protein